MPSPRALRAVPVCQVKRHTLHRRVANHRNSQDRVAAPGDPGSILTIARVVEPDPAPLLKWQDADRHRGWDVTFGRVREVIDLLDRARVPVKREQLDTELLHPRTRALGRGQQL
jgi:hypothetical protein